MTKDRAVALFDQWIEANENLKKELDYRTIKPNTKHKYKPWCHGTSQEVTLLMRFRANTVGFRWDHTNRKDYNKDTDTCSVCTCNKPDTVAHSMMECPRYAEARAKAVADLVKNMTPSQRTEWESRSDISHRASMMLSCPTAAWTQTTLELLNEIQRIRQFQI